MDTLELVQLSAQWACYASLNMMKSGFMSSTLPVDGMMPSQLYVSEPKYNYWKRRLFSGDSYDPIPIKRIGDLVFCTDGHSRALATWEAGHTELVVEDDTDELDWMAYLEDVKWCSEEGIRSIADLSSRIVDEQDYQRLWRDRCANARQELIEEPFRGIELRIAEDPVERAKVCEMVLRSLPEWFGIEESIREYVNDVAGLETVVMYAFGTAIGFVSSMYHTSRHVDLHVLGLLREFHGRGLGTKLLDEAEGNASARGVRYVTVKTLADSHPDRNYAKTREFYLRRGYERFEVFPELWGKANPCLYMLKDIASSDA